LGEIERNRDYYGQARFDDIGFQLSAQGQELQARFIEQYADKLHEDIADDLVLTHGKPVAKTGFSSPSIVRKSASFEPAGDLPRTGIGVDVQSIGKEVEAAQTAGRKRIGIVRGHLQGLTKGAQGATESAADDVKEWGN
jgi:conjugal transfer mating pair stabilization protein TraG